MPVHKIPYLETGYFSQLICDYLDQNEALTDFYGNFPMLENFKKQIGAKDFSPENRDILVSALRNQYKSLQITEGEQQALTLLEKQNTYTVTTGHQLNLFTGPLYFLYKIISTITLSRKLNEGYPNCNFVPIYWMATEDHDFDEINYFRLHGKKIQWNRTDIQDNDKGAVGELKNAGLEEIHIKATLFFNDALTQTVCQIKQIDFSGIYLYCVTSLLKSFSLFSYLLKSNLINQFLFHIWSKNRLQFTIVSIYNYQSFILK